MSKASTKQEKASPNGSPAENPAPQTDQPEAATPESSPANFPLDSFREAARELRRPFTPEAVKWKTQSGTLVVPYVDARLVIERLNLVVPHLWHDEYEPTPKGLMWCHLTIDGITRSDVGEGRDKGLVSDALKRAAVHFGVGVSLYALPKVFLSFEHGQLVERTYKGKDGKQKKTVELTDKGRKRLDGGYRDWLKKTGEPMFGPVLDHGDVAGALGDVEAEAEAGESEGPSEDGQPAKLDDAAAKALIEAAETAYEKLPKAAKSGKGGLTPAAFRRKLDGAVHSESHDDLEKLVAELGERGGKA